MAPPNAGRGAWVGFGAQSAFATADTRTVFARLISADLTRVQNDDLSSVLHHGDAADVRHNFQVSEVVEGSIVFRMRYDGVGLLLRAALGAVTDAGTGSPYTHTATMDTSLELLSVEVYRGTAAVSELFDSCKVRRIVITQSAQSECTVELDIIGRTGAARGAASTPTFTDHEVVRHNNTFALSWGGAVSGVTDWTLTLDNGLAEVRELGSLFTQEMVIGSGRIATLDLGLHYRSDTGYNVHQALTEQDGTLTITGGTSPNAIAFLLRNAKMITHNGGPISDFGVVTEAVTLRGHADGTDPSLQITVTNATASGIAN